MNIIYMHYIKMSQMYNITIKKAREKKYDLQVVCNMF